MSTQSLKIKNRQHQLTLKIKKALSQLPCVDLIPSSSKLQYTDNIQNGRYVKLSYLRQKQLTNIFMALLCINIVMLYIYYQLDFNHNEITQYWLLLTYLTHVACSIFFGILFAISYENLNKISKNEYNFAYDICKVLLFFLIHPFPWTNQQTIQVTYEDLHFQNSEFPFKVNYLLLLVSVIKKLIIFFVKSLVNTQYIGPRSNRIKKIYSVSVEGTIYAIRCLFKDFPIKIFVGFFVIGELYFSYSLKITESNAPILNNPFQHYQNCLWFVLMTNTTVGFGQFRPFSHIGYILNILCMIWGALFISSILVIVRNTFSLSSKQETSLTALKRVQNHLKYREICRKYIQISLVRLWTNYKKRKFIRQSMNERKIRLELGLIRRQSKTFNSTGNIAQLSQRQFDNILINIEYLVKNNSQLLSFIGNHIFSQKLHQVSNPQTPFTPNKTQTYTINESDQGDNLELISINKIQKLSRFNKGKQSSKHIRIRLFRQASISQQSISQYKQSSKKYQ